MKQVSENIEKQFNQRIKAEYESAMIYKMASNFLIKKGFENAGKLWAKYSNEEIEHANKAMEYLLDRDCEPIIPVIAQPKIEITGLKSVIDLSYSHEVSITKQCRDLAKTAMLESDLVTYEFVSGFYLKEQIEEEAKILKFKRIIETMGDQPDTWQYLEGEFSKYL